jgi:glucokinase
VVNGRVLAGAHGAAGEMGHIVVRPGGPPCGCGAQGCVESIASAAAIGRRYADLSGRTDATAIEVAASAAAGEPLAADVWREALAALADGLVTVQAVVDAGTIVLGGGLAEAGDALRTPLRAALEQRVTFHRLPRLIPAALGDTAGCLGAALLALDSLAPGTTECPARSDGMPEAGTP